VGLLIVGSQVFEYRYTVARKRPSEAEILAQLTAAEKRGRSAAAMEPRARSAYFDAASGRIAVELTNGCVFAFPPALAQGLGSASPEELATVEVMPGAESIYWPCLDVGFSVPNLISGSFGTKAWMREMGRSAGSARAPRPPPSARTGRKADLHSPTSQRHNATRFPTKSA
jgi:hypothetical protein